MPGTSDGVSGAVHATRPKAATATTGAARRQERIAEDRAVLDGAMESAPSWGRLSNASIITMPGSSTEPVVVQIYWVTITTTPVPKVVSVGGMVSTVAPSSSAMSWAADSAPESVP